MSHPRKKSVSIRHFAGQSKILIAEPPGRHALLFDRGEPTAMKFADAHAALDWCEVERVSFFYLRSAPVPTS